MGDKMLGFEPVFGTERRNARTGGYETRYASRSRTGSGTNIPSSGNRYGLTPVLAYPMNFALVLDWEGAYNLLTIVLVGSRRLI